MATVTIYTTQTCPYCVRAKALLTRKHIPFEEIDVSNNDALRDEMVKQSGRRTVPQIFIDGQPIGGCDDLHALEAEGKLDEMLNS